MVTRRVRRCHLRCQDTKASTVGRPKKIPHCQPSLISGKSCLEASLVPPPCELRPRRPFSIRIACVVFPPIRLRGFYQRYDPSVLSSAGILWPSFFATTLSVFELLAGTSLFFHFSRVCAVPRISRNGHLRIRRESHHAHKGRSHGRCGCVF